MSYIPNDWGIWAVVIFILVKMFSSQLISFLPGTLQNYIAERGRLRADQQEHEQAVRTAEMNLVKLKELSQLSSLSFTEEQLTQLTAETQTQLNEANSFIRQMVAEKLDILIEGQRLILKELRDLRAAIRTNGNGERVGTKKLENE